MSNWTIGQLGNWSYVEPVGPNQMLYNLPRTPNYSFRYLNENSLWISHYHIRGSYSTQLTLTDITALTILVQQLKLWRSWFCDFLNFIILLRSRCTHKHFVTRHSCLWWWKTKVRIHTKRKRCCELARESLSKQAGSVTSGILFYYFGYTSSFRSKEITKSCQFPTLPVYCIGYRRLQHLYKAG